MVDINVSQAVVLVDIVAIPSTLAHRTMVAITVRQRMEGISADHSGVGMPVRRIMVDISVR
jgi:hypothetical protein